MFRSTTWAYLVQNKFHTTDWKQKPQYSSENCCVHWVAYCRLLWRHCITQRIKKNPKHHYILIFNLLFSKKAEKLKWLKTLKRDSAQDYLFNICMVALSSVLEMKIKTVYLKTEIMYDCDFSGIYYHSKQILESHVKPLLIM